MAHRILLVDDNAQARSINRSRLAVGGFLVEEAENGVEAIKKLQESVPDLIILDLMMPIIDGFKVLQMIKTNPALKDIPVVVLSGRGQPEEVEKALKLGATDFLVKMKTNPNVLLEKINSIIEKGPRLRVTPHYLLEVKEGTYDALYLAKDFSLPPDFRCAKCQGPLLLELLPDFSHHEPWFTGHFTCPACR